MPLDSYFSSGITVDEVMRMRQELLGYCEWFISESRHKCPNCQKQMMIAGFRERKEERAEGKEVQQRFTCHGCGNQVIPVKIS